jgi:hypothetical protein
MIKAQYDLGWCAVVMTVAAQLSIWRVDDEAVVTYSRGRTQSLPDLRQDVVH